MLKKIEYCFSLFPGECLCNGFKHQLPQVLRHFQLVEDDLNGLQDVIIEILTFPRTQFHTVKIVLQIWLKFNSSPLSLQFHFLLCQLLEKLLEQSLVGQSFGPRNGSAAAVSSQPAASATDAEGGHSCENPPMLTLQVFHHTCPEIFAVNIFPCFLEEIFLVKLVPVHWVGSTLRNWAGEFLLRLLVENTQVFV